jgi:hypothetical protein
VRIEPRRRLIPQLLDAQPRHFAPPAPARRERQEEDREVAASASRSVAQVTISRFKTSRVTARLLLRWRGLGEAREPPIAALIAGSARRTVPRSLSNGAMCSSSPGAS